MIEIEIKFRVTAEDHERISKLLAPMAASEHAETDTYFTSRHRDFIVTEECLRVRESPAGVELTWKPPTSEQMRTSDHYWKEELNVAIASDPSLLIKLLRRIDFVPFSVVAKNRRVHRMDDETTVMLDEVRTAGYFVEIETMSDSTEAAIDKNRAIAQRLAIHDREVVKTPYRDLVERKP